MMTYRLIALRSIEIVSGRPGHESNAVLLGSGEDGTPTSYP